MKNSAALWFAIVDGRLLLDSSGSALLASCPVCPSSQISFSIGQYFGQELRLVCLTASQLAANSPAESASLRELLMAADDALAQLLCRAAQISSWYLNHRFCSRCGDPVGSYDADFAARCETCGYLQYPRLSPCIIVLVRRQGPRGEQCLLAQGAHFKADRYSTLAGFIEAGETAEQAVAREVREEVGVEINNIRYWKSQSWPFPHSLMLAFFADYASGDLIPDGHEILKAQWFDVDDLPALPPSIAISSDLIEGFKAGIHWTLSDGESS